MTSDATRKIAEFLERRGFTLTGIHTRTPDGRDWEIAPVVAGRTAYRLFEIDRERDVIEEHDAVDGDTWDAGDLVDYLNAVGQPRASNQDRT